MIIKARFGSTVARLVAQGLGIAVLDVFTAADLPRDRLAVDPIEGNTRFETFIASRPGAVLSSFAQLFVEAIRREMRRQSAWANRGLDRSLTAGRLRRSHGERRGDPCRNEPSPW